MDTDANPGRYAHVNPHLDAHTYANARCNADTAPHFDAHTYANARCNAGTDVHSHPNAQVSDARAN